MSICLLNEGDFEMHLLAFGIPCFIAELKLQLMY